MAEAGWDALYLSPHLDDAALSCGGQIDLHRRASRRVVVATLFAGDPPPGELPPVAVELHRAWGLDPTAAMLTRRLEDLEAMAELGCEADPWPLVDAVYRRDPETGAPIYPHLRDLFGRPAAADAELTAEIVQRLGRFLDVEEVHAPLGVGGHVDHRLTRRAAEEVFGGRVRYYEDYPYAEKRRALWVARWRVLGWPWSWRSERVVLDEEALQARISSIARYRSQVGMLFGGSGGIEARVRRFVHRRGGERLWLPSR